MIPFKKKIFDTVVAEGVALRHDFHQHPEGGFKEMRTAHVVADVLRACGISVVTGVGKTGVIGTLKGNGKSRKVIGLRADMDALAMHEKGSLAYGSINAGYTHACGHDGHTATLLAAAKYLSALKKYLPGTVRFFFQPAEEGLQGAKYMVGHPAWKRLAPHMMFGIHYWPNYKTGTAGTAPGPFMAAGGRFRVTFIGKGGHGANPHKAVDPVQAACHAALALNTIVARENDAQNPAVVTTAMVHAGSAFNIIPQTADIEGTFRSLSDENLRQLGVRIRKIASDTAALFRCKAHVTIQHLFPVTMNHAAATALMIAGMQKTFGEKNIFTATKPSMGSEDFSFFCERVPAAYFFLGSGPSAAGLHNPAYNFNDRALPFGVKAWISVVNEFFRTQKS